MICHTSNSSISSVAIAVYIGLLFLFDSQIDNDDVLLLKV